MKLDVMPTNYNDFSGLQALKSRASQGESPETLDAAAKQFEAMFIQMMMKSMRDANATMKSGLFDNAGTDMFEEMLDKEFSVQFGEKGAFGLAEMLVQQLGETALKTAPQTNSPDTGSVTLTEKDAIALPLTSTQLRLKTLNLEARDE